MPDTGPLPRVEVVDYDTEQVVKVVTVPPGASAERVDRGVNINLDHEKYFTRVVEHDEEPSE